MRVAVVLFNLGGPDSLDSVRPFLRNLFSDYAIIRLPYVFRSLLAWYISTKRTRFAQEIYKQMGGKSSILEETIAQATLLENSLNQSSPENTYKCFIGMRYWKPFIEQSIQEIIAWKADHIVLLPLYPQYSTTTTASSFLEWKKQAQKHHLSIPISGMCCYPTDEKFIQAHVLKIKDVLEQLTPEEYKNTRILFSAHGLPQKIVDDGDPYVYQVQSGVEKILEGLQEMGHTSLDTVICYQSKVGRLQWVTPSTEEEIHKASLDKKGLIICPIAFVSEHSETKVELDIEYKELSESLSIPFYYRIPTLSNSPEYIDCLVDIVLQAQKSKTQILSPCLKKCSQHKRCYKNNPLF
jgi:protoporphyrin/coproporphyrin ferrochelatase